MSRTRAGTTTARSLKRSSTLSMSQTPYMSPHSFVRSQKMNSERLHALDRTREEVCQGSCASCLPISAPLYCPTSLVRY